MSSVGRGVRSLRFIPTVAEISAADAGEVPGLEAVVSHWTEGAFSASEWYAEVSHHPHQQAPPRAAVALQVG